MQVDLAKLLELKEKVVGAESFDDPWEFFFDHFGDKPAFIDMGEEIEHPMLEAVVKKLITEMYQQEGMVAMVKPMLKKLEEYQFIHGSFMVQGRIGILIFFADIDIGLMSLSSAGPDSPTMMMRFSTYEVDEDKALNLSPQSSREVN